MKTIHITYALALFLSFSASHGSTPQIYHDHIITDIAFAPKDTLFATASTDTTVKVWRYNQEKPVAVLRHANPVTQVIFNPHAPYLATVTSNTAHIWEKNDSGFKKMLEYKHNTSITGLFFPHDEKVCISYSQDGIVKKVSLAGSASVCTQKVQPHEKMAFSSTHRAFVYNKNNVQLSYANGKLVGHLPLKDLKEIETLSLSPTHLTIIGIKNIPNYLEQRTVYRIDLKAYTQRQFTIKQPRAQYDGADISGISKFVDMDSIIATRHAPGVFTIPLNDGRVCVYDLEGGKIRRPIIQKFTDITYAAISPKGHIIAAYQAANDDPVLRGYKGKVVAARVSTHIS